MTERDSFPLLPLQRRVEREHLVGNAVDRLWTLPEVAAYLSVSPKTVRRLIGRGLPCVRLGRVVRFRQADLLRFVEARKE